MRFGERLRELRRAKGFTLRDLAGKVGVGFTYLSRAENERLQYGDYPSDALIGKLAKALDADADELLFLAKRIPDRMKRRILGSSSPPLRLSWGASGTPGTGEARLPEC